MNSERTFPRGYERELQRKPQEYGIFDGAKPAFKQLQRGKDVLGTLKRFRFPPSRQELLKGLPNEEKIALPYHQEITIISDGDSLNLPNGIRNDTAGTYQKHSLTDFAVQIAMRKGFEQVSGENYAIPGSTSWEILNRIRDGKTGEAIRNANGLVIATFWMGGNDHRYLLEEKGREEKVEKLLYGEPLERILPLVEFTDAFNQIRQDMGKNYKAIFTEMAAINDIRRHEKKPSVVIGVILPPDLSQIDTIQYVPLDTTKPSVTHQVSGNPLLQRVAYRLGGSVIEEMNKAVQLSQAEHPNLQIFSVPTFGLERPKHHDNGTEHFTAFGEMAVARQGDKPIASSCIMLCLTKKNKKI